MPEEIYDSKNNVKTAVDKTYLKDQLAMACVRNEEETKSSLDWNYFIPSVLGTLAPITISAVPIGILASLHNESDLARLKVCLFIAFFCVLLLVMESAAIYLLGMGNIYNKCIKTKSRRVIKDHLANFLKDFSSNIKVDNVKIDIDSNLIRSISTMALDILYNKITSNGKTELLSKIDLSTPGNPSNDNLTESDQANTNRFFIDTFEKRQKVLYESSAEASFLLIIHHLKKRNPDFVKKEESYLNKIFRATKSKLFRLYNPSKDTLNVSKTGEASDIYRKILSKINSMAHINALENTDTKSHETLQTPGIPKILEFGTSNIGVSSAKSCMTR